MCELTVILNSGLSIYENISSVEIQLHTLVKIYMKSRIYKLQGIQLGKSEVFQQMWEPNDCKYCSYWQSSALLTLGVLPVIVLCLLCTNFLSYNVHSEVIIVFIINVKYLSLWICIKSDIAQIQSL
jgi:hypothetical protein